MDVGKKGFINFKDVSVLLSMMCGTDIQKKLKLLYRNVLCAKSYGFSIFDNEKSKISTELF